jgi:hypothetical protein
VRGQVAQDVACARYNIVEIEHCAPRSRGGIEQGAQQTSGASTDVADAGDTVEFDGLDDQRSGQR